MADTPPVDVATDSVVVETIFVRTEGGAILEMDLPLSAPIAARVAKQEIIRVANLDGDPWVEVDVVLVEEVADDTSTEAPPAGDTSPPVPGPMPVPPVADPAPAEPAPAPDPVPAPDAAPEPVPAPTVESAPADPAPEPVDTDPVPVTEPTPVEVPPTAETPPEVAIATSSVPPPAGNATAEEWRAYAVTRGMAPDEANALSRDQLRDAYKAS